MDPGPTVAYLTNAPASTPGLVECTLVPGKTFLPEGADRRGGVLRDLHSKTAAVGRKGSYVLCPDEDRGQDGGKAVHVHQAPLGDSSGQV